MSQGRDAVWSRTARLGLILLPTLAALLSVYSLTRHLPYDYYPYFWDGASLLREVGDGRLLTSGPSSYPSYALPKFAYAIQIDYAVKWFGFSGVLLVNLIWYALMLGAGVWALGRKTAYGRGGWPARLSFLAGMLALPFVHKYIGMANPTIQAMALWLLFLIAYGRSRNEAGLIATSRIALGLLAALIVLTDFPKWLIILVPTILFVELADPLVHRFGWRVALRHGLKRALAILPLSLVGVGLACLAVPHYYHNNVAVRLFEQAVQIDTIRPALSWNLVVYLVILGGICIALFLIVFGRRLLPRLVTVEPGVLAAAAVVVVFSCLIWPRSARMFSVVVPFMIYLFARAVQRAYDPAADDDVTPSATGNAALRGPGRRTVVAAALVVTVILVIRAPFAGACFTLPTGVREVNAFIAANVRMSKDGDIGTYLWPNFQLSVPSGREWKYIPKHTSLSTGSSIIWAVTGELVEEMIIEEQALHGGVSLNWRTNQLAILALLRRGSRGAEFPNGFYTSKWYISESVFEDGYLVFLLRRAALVRNPKWQLRSVAHALRGR